MATTMNDTARAAAAAAAAVTGKNQLYKSDHHETSNTSEPRPEPQRQRQEQQENRQQDNNNNYPSYRGTLSYNLELNRHIIRGMWNYQQTQIITSNSSSSSSKQLPPQRFQLLRTLQKDEDPTELPKDGEFHGSFGLAYYHTTSKGKRKERKKVIQEHGVKITFTKEEDGNQRSTTYNVTGKGTNQFGVFHLHGIATLNQQQEGGTTDPTYDIVFQKRYEPGTSQVGSNKKRKRESSDENGNGSSGSGGTSTSTSTSTSAC